MGCANSVQVQSSVRYKDAFTPSVSSDLDAISEKESVCAREQNISTFHKGHLLQSKLGSGSFAKVYAVQRCHTLPGAKQNEKVAAKVMDLRSKTVMLPDGTPALDTRYKMVVEKETTIMKKLSAMACCVKLIDWSVEGHFAYMVMERCDATLYTAIMTQPVVTERDLGRLFAQMLRALCVVHALKIVHRDVKPDNFLFNGSWKSGVVKLCDFGLAEIIEEHKPLPKDRFGTAPFMAPEMLQGKPYNVGVDVWSFGVLAYALLMGVFPYNPAEKTAKAMKQAILDDQPPPSYQPKHAVLDDGNPAVTAAAIKFLKDILVRDPEARPTASTVLEHEWLLTKPNEADSGFLLPDIKLTLKSAQRAGAFTVPKSKTDQALDPMESELADLQESCHGSTPWLQSLGPRRLPAPKEPMSPGPSFVQTTTTMSPPETPTFLRSSSPRKARTAPSPFQVDDNNRILSGTGFDRQVSKHSQGCLSTAPTVASSTDCYGGGTTDSQLKLQVRGNSVEERCVGNL